MNRSTINMNMKVKKIVYKKEIPFSIEQCIPLFMFEKQVKGIPVCPG